MGVRDDLAATLVTELQFHGSQYIAEVTKTRVKFIAVGPGREETIILPRSIGRGGAV